MRPTESPLLRSTTANMPNPRRYQWPIRLEKERHASKRDIGFPSTAMKRITSGSAHIPAYSSKSSAYHSLRMSRSVYNGVVSNPFIAAAVRLILRVCSHNPAMKSSDPIQRSDSCSVGVHVSWLARFPEVAYVAIQFMRIQSDTQDSVRRSLGNPKAARRWGAGNAAGRSTRFARTLEG